jgi:lipopolysaccharide exporter
MDERRNLIDGTKWTSYSTGLSIGLQFIQIAILARLLGPTAFGIVSISTMIINLFNVFANLGFANSIIYTQETDRENLSTIYFFNLFIGAFIFCIIYISTPLVVSFYNEIRLDKVVRFSAGSFLIVYFGQIYSFILRKELRFRALAIIDIISIIVGTIVTISCAYAGLEEMSLIYGQLVTATIRTIFQILFGRSYFIPTFSFKLSGMKDHFHFGIYNVGEGLVNFFQYNIDYIIIGKLLSVKLLGFYTIAYQLAIFPGSRLNPIFLQVAYPVLAKIKNDNLKLRRYYLSILDIIGYINIPMLAGLFVMAESVIPLIYGPGWEETIYLIYILIFGAFFSSLSQPLSSLAYSKGRPKLLFQLNSVTTIIRIPLFYFLGRILDVKGIAIAFSISSLIHLIIKLYIVRNLIGNYLLDFLINIIKPVSFSLIMILSIGAYRYFIHNNNVISIAFQIGIGVFIYTILTLYYKFSLKEVRAILKN